MKEKEKNLTPEEIVMVPLTNLGPNPNAVIVEVTVDDDHDE